MSEINFPDSPTLNQEYIFGDRIWVWNGSGWILKTSPLLSETDVLNRENHTGFQSASTITGLNKGSVGLGNVDNTSDIDKPLSQAAMNALGSKANTTHTHSKSEVGLGNVDNTSDADKPISDLTQAALSNKANTNLDNVSQSDARTKVGTGTMAYRAATISTSEPSGGDDGDVWFKVEA